VGPMASLEKNGSCRPSIAQFGARRKQAARAHGVLDIKTARWDFRRPPRIAVRATDLQARSGVARKQGLPCGALERSNTSLLVPSAFDRGLNPLR
jgi:hypothetical protein